MQLICLAVPFFAFLQCRRSDFQHDRTLISFVACLLTYLIGVAVMPSLKARAGRPAWSYQTHLQHPQQQQQHLELSDE